jgi:hypothetical protein
MNYRNRLSPLYLDNQRLDVFSFWPNYTRDFMMYWEWNTDILTAYAGKEQRRGLRRYPRCSLEYEVFASKEDRSALANTLLTGQTKTILAAVWAEEMILPDEELLSESISTVAEAKGTVLPLVNRYFTEGGYLVCLLSPSYYEARQILKITATSVTLDKEVTWVPGSPVYPALPSRMNNQQVLDQVTLSYSTAVVTLNCFALQKDLYTYIPFTLFLGYPVVEDVLDWGKGERVTADYRVQLIDNKTGFPDFDVLGNVAEVAIDTHWFLPSSASPLDNKLLRFMQFIHYCKGRLKPFWFPTGSQDLIAVNISINGELVVQDAGLHAAGIDNTGRRYLRIETTDNVHYLKIAYVNYAALLGKEFIGLYNELGAEYNVRKGEEGNSLPFDLADICSISFLVLARLNTDRVEVAYKSPCFATALLPIRTLINEL